MHYLEKELQLYLTEKPELFNFFQETISDGLWYWDIESGDEEWFSHTFWQTLGYDPEKMPYKVSAWTNKVHPEDIQKIERKFKEHLANPETPFDEVLRYYHSNGSLKYIRCKGKVIFNESGKPYRMVGSHVDITELKTTEINLKKELDFHKFIVNSQNAYVIIVDAEGCYSYVNDHFCKAVGLDRAQLIGMNTQSMLTCNDKELSKEIFELSIKEPGQRNKAVFTKRLNNGNELIAEWEFEALFNENKEFRELIGFGVDITERLKSEQIIKDQFALLEAIQNSSENPIFAVDIHMNYLAFNKAHQDAMKALYHVDIKVGAFTLDYINDPQQKAINAGYLARALAGEKVQFEETYGHDSQNLQYYELHIFPIYNTERIVGATLQAINKTELVKARKQYDDLFLQYQNILDGTQDALFLVSVNDQCYTYSKVNKSYKELIYLEANEIENKSPEEVFGQEIANTLVENYNKCLQAGKPISYDEAVFWKGEFRIFHTKLNPIYGESDIFIVGSSSDVTKFRQQQELIEKKNFELLRREEMLIAISKATEELLINNQLSKAIENSLKILLKGIRADQAYYFEISNQKDNICASHVYECFLDGRPDLHYWEDAQNLPVSLFPGAYEKLIVSEPFVAKVKDISDDFEVKEMFLSQSILSFVFVPIKVNGNLKAFIGFDDCTTERNWSESELALLQSFANSLATAIIRDQEDKKLKSTEKILDRSSKLAKVGGWEMDMITGTSSLSDSACDIIGLPIGFTPTLEESFAFYPEGSIRDKVQFEFSKVLAGEAVYNTVIQLKRADGELIWINTSVEGEYELDGTCKKVFGVFQDITAQVNAQNQLIQSQALLQATSKMAKVGWYEKNFVLNTLEWSDITKEIHEVGAEFIPDMQKGIEFYKPGKSRETISNVVNKALAYGEAFDVELEIVTAKGSDRWVRVIGNTEFINGKCVRFFGTFQDIHASKMQEFARLESELLFRSIVENAHDLVLIMDENSKLHYISPQWKEMLGYEIEPYLNKSAECLIHPEDLPAILESLSEYINGKRKQLSSTYRVKHKNGSWRWHQSRGSRIQLHTNESQFLVMIRDVTDFKSKEIELLQSETRFRSLVEKSHEGISLCDRNGTITMMSGSVHLDMGYTTEELIGIDLSTLSHPDDLERANGQIANLIMKPGESLSIAYRMRKKDGSYGWILSNITNLLREPFVEALVFNFIDISELKETENQLIKTKNEALEIAKEYKSILDSQAVYIVKTDLEGRYTYVNDYFKLKHSNSQELLGQNSMENIIPEDHEICFQTIEKCLLNPGKTFEVILRKPNDFQGTRGSKWEFMAVLDSSNSIKEIHCVGFDITNELKSLENTQRLLAITQNQNQRLIEYTHITSHNLRSPVARILGLCTLLEAEPDNIQYRELLKVSAHTLDDTIRWMNKLLDIENEEQASEKENILLKDIIKNNLDLYQDQINGALITNTLPDGYSVPGYSLYLDSVFNNLLSNALKYKKYEVPLEIIIEAVETESMIGFSIADNGIGIDLEKYGNKLFKLRGRLSTHVEGKGIGLFFTKRQIEQMGGDISISSQLHEGTKFTVLLPKV